MRGEEDGTALPLWATVNIRRILGDGKAVVIIPERRNRIKNPDLRMLYK